MKASPYTLQPKVKRTFDKTFADYPDLRFTCSCGCSFNGFTPDCPKHTDVEDTSHVVKESKPNLAFEVKFRMLGQMEAMSLVGFINEMVEKYVTGYGLPGKKDYIKPVALPPVGTESVSVSETACQVAAFLWKAQVGKDEDRYSFEELLTFMVSDSICQQMCAVALELQDDGDTENPLAKPVEG